MARLAHETTVRRFGRTVHLFAPLYLSNECVSTCTYCGFSAGNEIARRTLSPAEVVAEARTLTDRGFRHLHQCISWNRLVLDAVTQALGEGRMPQQVRAQRGQQATGERQYILFALAQAG